MNILTALFFLMILCIGCDSHFNKEEWLKHPEVTDSKNPRFDMVEDLCNNIIVKGKTNISEIEKSLGKPLYVDTFKSTIEYQYPIGSNPGFHIDPYFLVIEFNNDSMVIATRIIEH